MNDFECYDPEKEYRDFQQIFLQETSDHWSKKLEIVKLSNIMKTDETITNIPSDTFQFSTLEKTPDFPCGPVKCFKPTCAVRSDTIERNNLIQPIKIGPKYGKHTQQILEEFGYSKQEIQKFIENNVVADKWSDEYMPSIITEDENTQNNMNNSNQISLKMKNKILDRFSKLNKNSERRRASTVLADIEFDWEE